MPVAQGLVSGRGTLFGGAGLGACIAVAERATGRPVVWAAAQYLSFARPGAVLTLDVEELVRGHQTSQVRVVARVGAEEILGVTAALGRRPFPIEGQWPRRPTVPPPEDCPPRDVLPRHDGTMMSRLGIRLADGPETTESPTDRNKVSSTDSPTLTEDGRCSVWVKLPDGLESSPAALAVVGDLVPFGVRRATGRQLGGSSLDNTLRVAHHAPTEWVLADVRVHSVAGGYGHGLVHLWAECGTLLGTASQSIVIRGWKDEPPPDEEDPR